MVLIKSKISLIILLIGLSAFGWYQLDIQPMHLKQMEKKVNKYFKAFSPSLESQDKWMLANEGIGYRIPVLSKEDSTLGYLHYRKAAACNFGGCVDTTCDKGSIGFKEYIYYYAILDLDSNIQKLGILEYESNYGYEISSQAWLKQFYQQQPGGFKLGKNVDGISGATVSVNAMIADLNSL
ncbi:MAG: FMN-binding protein [Bacteroidia bacterium]